MDRASKTTNRHKTQEHNQRCHAGMGPKGPWSKPCPHAHMANWHLQTPHLTQNLTRTLLYEALDWESMRDWQLGQQDHCN